MSLKRPFESTDSVQSSGQVHKKRRHEYSEDDAQLASIYERLSDDDSSERIAAVRHLKAFIEGRPTQSPIGPISARLIRGLCSARKASRAGFYNALVEVLWGVSKGDDALQTLERLLEQIKDETTPPKAASNAERHQHSLGQLTAYHALVTSELVFATGISIEQLRSFISRTTEVASVAAPLLEGCGKLWVDLVRAAAARKAYKIVSMLLNTLNDGKRLKTPEGVAVWLACSPFMRKVEQVPAVWPEEDPLMAASDLLNCLVRVLPRDEQLDNDRDQTGYAQRTPHFVWGALLADTARRSTSSNAMNGANAYKLNRSGDARAFWLSAFDDVFFASKASGERKAIGLKVFEQTISIMPDDSFDMFLTQNLLQCLLNQLTSADRYLHEAAHDVLDRLKNRLSGKQYPRTLQTLLQKLLWIHEDDSTIDLAFSRKTGPLVEALIRASSYSNLKTSWRMLDGLLEFPASAHVTSTAAKQAGIILDHLVTVHEAALSHPEDEAGRLSVDIATSLIIHALHIPITCSVAGKENRRPFAEQAQMRLWSVIKQLIVKKRYGQLLKGVQKLQDVDSVQTWLSGETAEEIPAPINSFFESRLDSLAQSLHKGSNEDRTDGLDVPTVDEALAALWSTLIFAAYSGREEATGLLEDLATADDKSSKNRNDYLDIIMALTSMEEPVFRLGAEQAFAAFANDITSEGLQPLFDVLAQQENAAGQRELFDQHSDDDEEGSVPEEQDSDVEIVNGNASSEDEASNGSSSNEDDRETHSASADSSGEEDTDPNDEALNASLGRILQTQGLDTNGELDAEAPDPDASESDSDSDADMTDSEMERLNIDNQLSSIFKQRATTSHGREKSNTAEDKKKQQKDSKRLVVAFKRRVLGLLSIYVQPRYSSRECLSILVPLCQLIGATRDAQLAKKASELLERYISLCKKKPEGLPLRAKKESLWLMLDEVHEEVLLWRGKQHLSACSRASIFLARLLVEKSKVAKHQGRGMKNTVNRLRQRYETTQERKAELKSDLPNTFWENFDGWLKSMRLE